MFGRTFDDNNELIIDPAYIDDDVIFITGTKEEPKVNRSDVEKQIFGDDEKESKEFSPEDYEFNSSRCLFCGFISDSVDL